MGAYTVWAVTITLLVLCFYLPVWYSLHIREQEIEQENRLRVKKSIQENEVRTLKLETETLRRLVEKGKAIVESKEKDLLFVCMINSAYQNLTRNWLCNTKWMRGIHNRTLIICTDPATCDTLSEQFPDVGFFSITTSIVSNDALMWGQKSYISFLTARAQILSALVNADVCFVLFETDATWFRNPLDYFWNQSHSQEGHILLPLKGYPDHGTTLTFDPMLVKPSAQTKAFLRRLAHDLSADPKLYDQDILDQLCQKQYFGVYCETFPWEDIADGLWFKLSAGERARLRPYIVNNNYYVGVNNKISRQALNGLWFLDVGRKSGLCNRKRLASKIDSTN